MDTGRPTTTATNGPSQTTANSQDGYPDLGEVKIKDFNLSVNGKLYQTDELHLLPDRITPESAYTPRSDEVVFFFYQEFATIKSPPIPLLPGRSTFPVY